MADSIEKKFEKALMDEDAGKALADACKQLIEDKLKDYPKISASQRTDGIAYALVNGQFEGIASAGRNVVTYNPVTAATLQALETRRIPAGLSDEELEQVKKNLEEVMEFIEMPIETRETAATEQQKIQEAIFQFKARLEMERLEAEQMAQMQDQLEGGNAGTQPVKPGVSKDVEPKNEESV